MNTGTLNGIKEILVKVKKTWENAELPEDFPEYRRESQVMLMDVFISEIDREIESNRKRSERTKRCQRRKNETN